jgi:sulfate adenylyltransferase subunit 1
MTAGSVDDGKSTLIGRLLLDSKALMRDQVDAVDDDDLAALTDGLEAERVQGITIDVAYRYFATPRTSFIIADAPGHEQYTRNMVTAASVSDVAVIVIDVSRVEGAQLKPQTRRHAAIAALMGLDIIVAVNKMDLVGWAQERFEDVRAAFGDVAAVLGIGDPQFVPLSARRGDNVVHRAACAWYAGPTLVELLEGARKQIFNAAAPLRLPVQAVLRDGDKRLYAGRIESGSLKPGDKVRVGSSLTPAIMAHVRIGGAGVPQADAGASVAVELSEERDLARGDVIADVGVSYARRVVADLCWLDQQSWTPSRRYRLRQGALETQALIERVRHVRDIQSLAEVEANALVLNDIASVVVGARDPLLADLYRELPGTGAFVLFDPDTNQTAAAGMIREIAT